MDKKPIELPPNTVIGVWKPSNLLGEGGQGAVWAAKPVKVKHTPQRALKACFASTDQGRARFVREVETLRRCDSPHVLKVYDQDLEWKEHVPGLAPFAYYVSEKCQGSMEQRQPHLGDTRRRLALFRQACTAVAYLHTMIDPVIHRDIKPANFLIAHELQNVVLADFGIARALADPSLTEMFEIVGTPFYRAPEVLHGSRGTVESDVYGLGRLLEWLLTNDVSKDMGTRPVPRGLELDDDACNALDGIIAKATQVTPTHRYRSVQALADQLPDLWISMRPRAKPGPVLPDTTAATVFPAALELARANDQLGWRQLENQLRRDFVNRIAPWRKEFEPKWRVDKDKDAGSATTDTLLDVAMGRIVFALGGVFSSNPSFADQRRLIDDLLSIPDWSLGGTTAIAHAPRALVYVVHYLHGALCMTYGQAELALQLAQHLVADTQRAETRPLWMEHEFNGWPKLLGGTCTWAWEYMCSMRQRQPILQQLFALQSDFNVGLAAYSMLLSLHELAVDAAVATPEQLADPKYVIDFPALFIGMPRETITVASRQTFGNRPLVARVAERAGAKVEVMRKLWPNRKQLFLKFYSDVFDRWGYRDNIPIGELA